MPKSDLIILNREYRRAEISDGWQIIVLIILFLLTIGQAEIMQFFDENIVIDRLERLSHIKKN